MFGNECTGDIRNVRNYLDLIEVGDDNWIKGIKGKFKICAKVFSTKSDFGIQGGRISKIQVCHTSQEHWGFDACYLNYDRGWDIRPRNPEIIEFMNGLLAAFGDDKLDDDDLVWYDVYIYRTEQEFESCKREYYLTERTMESAMCEARGIVNDTNTYAVAKVISYDSEEIEILRKGD